MEESVIQDICRTIYEKHRRALDVLFEHRPDRALEVSKFATSVIEETDGLVVDHTSKSYVHFISSELDVLPTVGEEWTNSKRLLLFELDNVDSKLSLKLILGPGPADLRQKIHEVIVRQSKVFNRANKKLASKWWSFHIEKWITKEQYHEIELEELQAQIREQFDRFVQSLPEMERALIELRDLT